MYHTYLGLVIVIIEPEIITTTTTWHLYIFYPSLEMLLPVTRTMKEAEGCRIHEW